MNSGAAFRYFFRKTGFELTTLLSSRQKNYKRAAKQGLKAYSWASFGLFYLQYKKLHTDEDDPHDTVRNKLKRYNLLLSYCNPGGASYEKIKQEKEDWLKSLHLEEDKIL